MNTSHQWPVAGSPMDGHLTKAPALSTRRASIGDARGSLTRCRKWSRMIYLWVWRRRMAAPIDPKLDGVLDTSA